MNPTWRAAALLAALSAIGCRNKGAGARGVALPPVEGVPVRIDDVRAEASASWLTGMNDVSFPDRGKGAKPQNQVWVTYRVTARDAVPDDVALEARSVCRWNEHVVVGPFVESLRIGSRRIGVGALGKGASAEGGVGAGAFPPFEVMPELCELELRYGPRPAQGSVVKPEGMKEAGRLCWSRGQVSAGACKDALRPGVGGGGGPVAHFEGVATEKGALFWFLLRGGVAGADVVTTRTTCRSGTTFSQTTESTQSSVRLADVRDTEVTIVSASARPARDQTVENAACEVAVFLHLKDASPGTAAATYCIEGAKAARGHCTI